ncbi:cyclic peptide export ABC transporter [Clostridium felsineum]|uniref:cyclic peptide export ABC transporter n=1 Tax=Clostridium felsineum TaxID=36839 RepID=UPI00098BFA3C|nr:cyclic peptide export ABC transporter [Clostridium felsineum]URZ01264.1 Vitamin B12 import ATP-binding protein BtuD [Clostridium felsineum]
MNGKIRSDMQTSMFLALLGIIIVYCFPDVILARKWSELYVQYGFKIVVLFCVLVAFILIYSALFIYFKMKLYKSGKISKSFGAYIVTLSIISGGSFTIIPYVINQALAGSIIINIYMALLFFSSVLLYAYDVKIVKKEIAVLTNGYMSEKRKKIINFLSECNYETFENIGSGNIYTCINNDTENISNIINILMSGLTSLAVMVCCAIYLVTLNFKLSCLALIAIVVLIAIVIFLSTQAQKQWEVSRDKQNLFYSYLDGFLKGFANLSTKRKKMNEFVGDISDSDTQYRDCQIKAESFSAYSNFISEVLIFVFMGMIVVVPPLISDEFRLKDISQFFVIFLMLKGHLDVVIAAIPRISKAMVSKARIDALLNEVEVAQKKKMDSKSEKILSQEFKELCYKKISYAYKNISDKPFKVGPLDLTFKKGEITFIIGGNGSGKSTLGKLITGLYHFHSGAAFYNSQVIENSKLSEIFSTIFFDNYLFSKLYGIDDIKDNKIDEILEKIKLKGKITIKNRIISDINLSTGQKKRIALMISYLEDMPIYFFDEWAAEQDPEFKNFFYRKILPELKAAGKCIIAITHDDRYFDVADKIVKLEDGKCVENLQRK